MSELTPAPTGYPIKLVRDRTAQIINGSDEPGDLFYDRATSEEHARGLRLKLAEEVAEYLVDGGLDELCDVLAVVEGLAHLDALTLDQLRERADADPRGGFLDGVMMRGRHPEFDEVSEISEAGRRDIRKSAAKLAEYREIPDSSFPGHKAIACANLEGHLGRYPVPLLDALEACESSARLLADALERIARGAPRPGRCGDTPEHADIPYERETLSAIARAALDAFRSGRGEEG